MKWRLFSSRDSWILCAQEPSAKAFEANQLSLTETFLAVHFSHPGCAFHLPRTNTCNAPLAAVLWPLSAAGFLDVPTIGVV